MKMNLPNKLTLLRMALVPVYLVLLNQAKEVQKNPSAYTTKAPVTTTTIAGGNAAVEGIRHMMDAQVYALQDMHKDAC